MTLIPETVHYVKPSQFFWSTDKTATNKKKKKQKKSVDKIKIISFDSQGQYFLKILFCIANTGEKFIIITLNASWFWLFIRFYSFISFFFKKQKIID